MYTGEPLVLLAEDRCYFLAGIDARAAVMCWELRLFDAEIPVDI